MAPPPDPVFAWLPAGVVFAVAMLLLVTGTVLWGVLALLATVVVGFAAHWRYDGARRKLEEWQTSLYCGHCNKVFLRADAIEAV